MLPEPDEIAKTTKLSAKKSLAACKSEQQNTVPDAVTCSFRRFRSRTHNGRLTHLNKRFRTMRDKVFKVEISTNGHRRNVAVTAKNGIRAERKAREEYNNPLIYNVDTL